MHGSYSEWRRLLSCCVLCLFIFGSIVGCWMKNKQTSEKNAAPPDLGPETVVTAPVATAPPPVREFLFEEPNPPQPFELKSEISLNDEDCRTPVAERENLPLVAIIIDDMGFHDKIARQLLALPLNLTFAFLPHAPFTKELEEQAFRQGHDVLLHVPMEPQNKAWDPGPCALYLSTPPASVASLIDYYLESVPHAIGANNHMGSLYTENQAAVHNVLTALQKRNFFFIDSYTSPKSIAMAEAQKMGIPTARRQIFLDNIHTQQNICHQLQKLLAIAQKTGWAIGIGHPNTATLTALTTCQKDLLHQVKVVSIHEVLAKQKQPASPAAQPTSPVPPAPPAALSAAASSPAPPTASVP